MNQLLDWLRRLRAGTERRPARRPSQGARRPRLQLGVETLEGRVVPAGVVANYAMTQDWGSGFQGEFRLSNTEAAPVDNWRLEFDFSANITSIWDAQIVSRTGTRYVITGAGWNSTLAGNGNVAFGFVAGPGADATPTDFVLNGISLNDLGAPPAPAPEPELPPPSDPGPPATPPPASTATIGAVQFTLGSDWGSGFTGEVTVRNTTTSALTDWTLTFEFAGAIASIWNAEIVSHVGQQYVVRHVGWNGTIASGASVSFGFVASPGGGSVAPTNFLLQGGEMGGPTMPVPTPDPSPTPDPGTPQSPPVVAPPMPSASAWPTQVFAPYVDMTLYPTYDLAAAARDQGLRYFHLAFVVADPSGQPSWGGYAVYGINGSEFDLMMRQQIAAVRQLGGDVSVSFGGAVNRELAEVITDVTVLKNTYRSVIDAYGLQRIDFDIEGAASAHRESIDRRWQAVALLQQELAAEGRTLEVSVTLPVLPSGLTHDGVYVVESALRHGVVLSGVNIMAMDYGASAAPNPEGRMGDYAIQAAESLFNQLRTLYGTTPTDAELWRLVGVTPMIGMNDVVTEIFDQQEARELLAFAQEKGIGMLSMWSLNRDQQHPSGPINHVDLKSSSIAQSPYEFSLLFNEFTSV